MEHLSLFDFTQVIKNTLEKTLQPTYWIVAEIGEIRIHPKGHCYLELVEKKDEKIVARMKATIWSSTYQQLIQWFQRITGSNLKQGMKVLTNAEAQFHEAFGLSLNIKDIDARYTLGERQKVKQQVIQKLEEEGLMTMNHKRDLPLVPQRIAIISSSQSAGYEDFLLQLKDTPYKFSTQLFPAEMQGEESTRSVVNALKNIFETVDQFDAVAILRGGGAQTDLDSFDTYLMSKAVARFPLPVITGIGHERDETVVDMVARVKLKTPTAVAEFIINGMEEYEKRLQGTLEYILSKAHQEVVNQRQQISSRTDGIRHHAMQLIIKAQSEVELVAQKTFHTVREHNNLKTQELEYSTQKIRQAFRSRLEIANNKLDGLEKLMQFSDPQYNLQRGYSYTSLNGKPLSREQNLKVGEILETRTIGHIIKSSIQEISKNE